MSRSRPQVLITSSDQEHIDPEDPGQPCGSEEIDTTYEEAEPQANQLDYNRLPTYQSNR